MLHYLYFLSTRSFIPRYIAILNKSVHGSVDYSAHQKSGPPDIDVNRVISVRVLTGKILFKRKVYVNEWCFS